MQTHNKLREALEDTTGLLESILEAFSKGTSGVYMSDVAETIDNARAALAEPMKNCEVGTAEEQAQRFMAVCESVKPAEPHYSETGEVLCPSIGSEQGCKLGICNFGQCALKWAQMPYEEGGAK